MAWIRCLHDSMSALAVLRAQQPMLGHGQNVDDCSRMQDNIDGTWVANGDSEKPCPF
jgi:hypothetical protein